MRRLPCARALLAAFVVVLHSRSADAAAPEPNEPRAVEDQAGVQIAPVIGYGLHSTRLAGEEIGALGFGFGARVGYVFAFGLYLGTTFMSHNGEARETSRGGIEGGLAYGGGEVGQQLTVGPMWIRAFVGGGLAHLSLRLSETTRDVDASGYRGSIWAGGTVLVPVPAISKTFFAGFDARYISILGVDQGASVNGVSLALTGGHKF